MEDEMGRLRHGVSIYHFSHPHPLKLTSLHHPHDGHPAPTCAGCGHSAPADDGQSYSCQPCGYTLHLSCAELPQRIHHPADPSHSLDLVTPAAARAGAPFTCRACGGADDPAGFFYRCNTCGLSLHCACAALPLSVSYGGHRGHPLTLFFSPPYENAGFSCDVCRLPGTFQWVYSCAMCGFDAHIGCATAWEVAEVGGPGAVTTTGLRVALQKLESGLGAIDKRKAKKLVKGVATTVGASLTCTIL